MDENSIRLQAIMQEKNSQMQSALDAVCFLKGELAVAKAHIEALTAKVNDFTSAQDDQQAEDAKADPAEHKAPNGLQ